MTEANLLKRRGVVCSSITKLGSRIKDLEAKTDEEGTLELAQQVKQRLERLNTESEHINMVWSISLMMKQHLVKNKQSLMSMMTLLAHFLFVFKGSSLLVFQHLLSVPTRLL